MCRMMRRDAQPHISAIVQARRFSLFRHIAWIPDETDAKILIASPFENWRWLVGRSRTTWIKTIRQDLKSNNLSPDETIGVAPNRPIWRLMSLRLALSSPSGACRNKWRRCSSYTGSLFTSEVDGQGVWPVKISTDESFRSWVDYWWTVNSWTVFTPVSPIHGSVQST